MTTAESRYLGPITLDGGAGGGAMNTEIPISGRPVPIRIEIDFPERLNESVVQDIDMVLESLTLIDELARDAIAAGLRRDGSAAIKLFRAWAGAGPGRAVAAAEFLSELQPTQLLVLPDGGRSNRDRVVVTYSLADSAMPGTITVRFLDPTGPELDPVQWTGIG